MSQINEGNGAGLLEFLDYLVDKRYRSKSAVTPWKSASRRVMEIVDGEDVKSVDVVAIDVDEYLSRFENGARGQYKAESLRAYRSRFAKAVDAYRKFLIDGTPPTFRSGPSSARTSRRGEPDTGTNVPAEDRAQARQSVAAPDLIDYPFPLQSGQLAQIRLPAKLAKSDAERLAAFVRTLVFEPQRELEPGDYAEAGPKSQ